MRIKETKEVYEGEVTELTPVETESPTAAAGSGSASGGGPVYGKTISHLIIGRKGRGGRPETCTTLGSGYMVHGRTS